MNDLIFRMIRTEYGQEFPVYCAYPEFLDYIESAVKQKDNIENLIRHIDIAKQELKKALEENENERPA